MRGLRIIVESKADCYRALRAVEVRCFYVRFGFDHGRAGAARAALPRQRTFPQATVQSVVGRTGSLPASSAGSANAPGLLTNKRCAVASHTQTVWKAVGPTKDYIRRPKENGYRSLHTVVRGEDGHDIEVRSWSSLGCAAVSRQPPMLSANGASACALCSGATLSGRPLEAPARLGLSLPLWCSLSCLSSPYTGSLQVQIRTAKMHFFAEYGSEAAHWQYKERGYGSSPAGAAGPAGPAAAAGPAATISSLDEDQPTAAGARSAGAGDAAREANWAKFVLSQQVGAARVRVIEKSAGAAASGMRLGALASVLHLHRSAAASCKQAGHRHARFSPPPTNHAHSLCPSAAAGV